MRSICSFPTKGWIFALLAWACGISAHAQALTEGLILVRKVPFAELKLKDGPPVTRESLSSTEGWESDELGVRYGWIQGGKGLYLGYGRVMDLATGGIRQKYPASVKEELTSRDGRYLYCMNREEGQERFGAYDTIEEKPLSSPQISSAPWPGILHPDGVTSAGPAERNPKEPGDLAGIGLSSKKGADFINLASHHFSYLLPMRFTDDGRYLVLGENRLIRTSPLKVCPLDPEMDRDKSSGDNHIGDSAVFVFNRDASLVAGKKGANDWSTFVWDRAQKRFLWEDAMTSEPSTWSPNDKYLYCCDTIVEAVTGKTVFEKLKGHRGKFSPDGRSLVTVDDEAFYVYTLPKESEPIFGVFQKPEPWSPAKAPVRKPKGKAKTK